MHIVADVGPEKVEIAHVPVVPVQPFADQEHVRLVDPEHTIRRNAAGTTTSVEETMEQA